MEDIYSLSDRMIGQRIGERLKSARLKQNITQADLAKEAGVSLSTVKKIEGGEIGSFDSFLRLLRTLGKLDVLQEFAEEEQMSPQEYYEFVNTLQGRKRQRAAGHPANKKNEEGSEW